MNNINFDALMLREIESLDKKDVKEKLLLHSCCAPCSSICIEELKNHFDLTVYYYNPNIDGDEEYTKRAEEQKKLCEILGVKCIITDWQSQEFIKKSVGYEKEREGGKRCELCFELRLKRTAEFAKENGYKYFATTLTVSPLKNSKLINEIGLSLEKAIGVKYFVSDFKKRGGYLKSIELSKKFHLYRQNYCGCEYSKKRDV